VLGGRGDGVGVDGRWKELELERNLTDERYRLRMLGLGGMPGVNQGDKPVMRIPRVVSWSIGIAEGEEEMEDMILGMERLGDRGEVSCAKYWHGHELVELWRSCKNLSGRCWWKTVCLVGKEKGKYTLRWSESCGA
jgi:hypothetical protein